MMTQEQKELFLKDLCARLPYGVKVQFMGWSDETEDYIDVVDTLYSVNTDGYVRLSEADEEMDIEEIRPYLFPPSSMTDEQKEEYCQLQARVVYNSKGPVNTDVINYINWCYKNHIDVNGLIPLGLANDATGLNIY